MKFGISVILLLINFVAMVGPWFIVWFPQAGYTIITKNIVG